MRSLATEAKPQLDEEPVSPQDAALYQLQDGSHSGPAFLEEGSTALQAGVLDYEIPFSYTKVTANLRLNRNYVEDPNDPPQDIRAVIMLITTQAMTIRLSGAPTHDNLVWRWKVVAPGALEQTLDSPPRYILDEEVVHTAGDESVAGVKTFSSAPVVPTAAFPETAVSGLVADLDTKALDSAVVHKTGTETVAGAKTFTGTLTAPLRDNGGRVFDVRAYGGLADDSTDNATAIADAITAAGSNPTIYLSKGVWRTSRINLSTPNLTIIGDGQGRTILKKVPGATGSDSSIVILTSSSATGFTIRNLTLDGNRANAGTYVNIGSNSTLFIGGSRSTVENCEVKGSCFSGIFVGETDISPDRVTIRNCWIHDNGGVLNSSGNGIGITAAGSALPTRLTIQDCTIEYNYNTITRPNDSAALNLTVGVGCIITNNFFRNNYNVNGGQIGVNGGGTISNNEFEMTNTFGSPADLTSGIELVDGEFAVISNRIKGYTGNAGIHFDGSVGGAGHSAIIGNKISGGPTGAGGIVLYGNQTDAVDAVAVTGNQIAASYGVLLNNVSTNINFAGNDVSQCGAPYAVSGGTVSDTVTGDLIVRPWTSYTPSVHSASGTITTLGTVTGRYQVQGKRVFVQLSIDITTNGSGGDAVVASLPVTPAAFQFVLSGREVGNTGYGLISYVPAGQALVVITKYDNTYLGGNGAVLLISGTYEAA